MSILEQQYKTLVIAATPLPGVVRKPAILKIWLLELSRQRLFLLAVLIILGLSAAPVSQSIVDYLYPLDGNSFVHAISSLFNSSSLRELEELRERRYMQLVLLFVSSGILAASIVLVLGLPKAIEKARQQASVLLKQSQSIESVNPALAETLARNANNLVLQPESLTEMQTENRAEPVPEPESLTKTKAVSLKKQPDRFVGSNQRYRIDRALASGGSGIVYQAQDTVLGRQVALKELLEDVDTDDEQAKRFKVEARALALLNHVHILPVYDLFEEKGRFWLVMELLKGGTLEDRITKQGVLDIGETVGIVTGIASGLGFAHQQGFVHRDIKPANILFSTDGSYRITDFGIAKHKSTEVRTRYGLILGSPGYMSPEQASGEQIDLRSDIYSLGITMYQMLTGRLPFVGDTSSVLAQHITRQPQAPSCFNTALTADLDAIVLKMIEKKPDDRYQSTDELINALDALNTGQAGL